MRVRERAADLGRLGFALVAVGFSPPAALAALARHVSWPGAFCSDEERVLYQRLGLGRLRTEAPPRAPSAHGCPRTRAQAAAVLVSRASTRPARPRRHTSAHDPSTTSATKARTSPVSEPG